jgi:hypothetical protein
MEHEIRQVVSEYDSSPSEINDGLCIEFAQDVSRRVDDAEECCTAYVVENDYMTYPPHSWVFDGENHYDAECPEGVSDFRELPFFGDVDVDPADVRDNRFTV